MLAALAGFYPAVADEPADDAGNAAALWRFLRMQASTMLACDFFQCATSCCMVEWRWKASARWPVAAGW